MGIRTYAQVLGRQGSENVDADEVGHLDCFVEDSDADGLCVAVGRHGYGSWESLRDRGMSG